MPDKTCPYCTVDYSEYDEVGVVNHLCTHDESNKSFCDGCVKTVCPEPTPF